MKGNYVPLDEISNRPQTRARRISALADVALASNIGFAAYALASRPISTFELLYVMLTIVTVALLLLRARVGSR